MLRAALLATSLSLWPEVNYEMRLRLDADAHLVAGRATVSFTNTSPKELKELWFHLYMNAFRSRETRFMRRSPRGPAGSRSGRDLGRPGAIAIQTLTWAEHGPENLWPSADPHSPGDPQDQTDICLTLPRGIRPGEEVTLAIDFETTLPELVERSGFSEEFHLVSGFYPKLARLSKAGDFDHFAYHPLAEFSANFGTYRVELDVPAAHKLGTSGQVISRRVEGTRAIVETQAERVHDFAWTSWPDFVEEKRTLGQTEVTLLIPKRQPGLARKYFETLTQLFEQYPTLYGPYPHSTLTVVHPPLHASPAGGMEYPRLITTGGIGWLEHLGSHYLELVTAHEFAHQWFQGLLASNEYQSPWLDESLTTLAESRFLEREFGKGGLLSTPFFDVSEIAVWRLGGFDTRVPSALLSAPEYGDFDTLARTIYARAPLALETIRRVYGQAQFDRALLNYATVFRFKHPSSEDFFETFRTTLGEDAVSSLKRLLEGQNGGYRLQGPKTQVLASGRFLTEALVVPEGPVLLTTELEARFTDGQVKNFPVRGETRIRFEHETPLHSLCVDPDRSIVIDQNLANNRFRPAPSKTQLGQKTFLGALFALFLSLLFT